ncbi:hypothetical protein GCM10008018_30830 [Paenibacillus marchantiophytorum]|uniref:Uncharacterized protein n=1 Tax=Paenibacillus marchantiophytorum TaxID=1619310 RepID=A0ABQ1ER00_9BACL|nr:hypothetical protein [Paenibacillus marchantiophytorum]GFZ82795.1 hypothetical protein GCM10008018_30830 [Paenibacillus marchantiophytorum]
MGKILNSKISVLLVCTLLISTLQLFAVIQIPQAKAADSVNKLVNGGFESGNSAWELDGTVINATYAHTGSNSLRLGSGETGVYQVVNEPEGSKLRVSGWGKADSGETVLLGVNCLDNDGRSIEGGKFEIGFSNADFKQKEIVFTTVPGTKKIRVYGYKLENVRGYAYLDDITLTAEQTQQPEPTTQPIKPNVNVIENAGFEENSQNWSFDGAMIDMGNKRSGTNAAKIGPGEGGAYYKEITVSDNVYTITIAGWGKVSKEGEKGFFGVDLKNDKGRIGKYQIEFTNVDGFEYKSLKFNIVPGTTKMTIYLYKMPEVGGFAYFDDLSLIADKEVADPPSTLREKVITNSVPSGYSCTNSEVPDEYFMTKNNKDYYYRTYKCVLPVKPMPSSALGSYKAVDALVSNDNHIQLYKRSYKLLTVGMWVWNFDVVLDPAAREQLLQFSVAKGINRLYLNTGSYTPGSDKSALSEQAALYRKFNKMAHQLGIAVEALDGQSDWVRESNHSIPLGRISEVIAFNASASDPQEKFDGVHHDNEPYTLADWETNKGVLAKNYLQLVEASMSLLQGKGLTFAVDIPFWYDETPINVTYHGETKPFNRHITDIVDYIGVMDYRDFANGVDGIISHGFGEVEYAAKVGKEAVIGVETINFDDATNPGKITFWQEGETYMNEQVALVDNYFSNSFANYDYKAGPGYKGHAIHHYLSYKELKK